MIGGTQIQPGQALTCPDPMMVKHLNKFTINNITKNLNKINTKISLSHHKPFPHTTLLSQYEFKKRFVKILPNGEIQGGLCKMITSLVDFSFIRSLLAECYSPFGPPPYDPPTIFLLDLFRFIDEYHNMNDFLSTLRDKDKGRAYRTYAGIIERIPSEATFSEFRTRIGEKLYNEIFHVLVDIFHQLEIITFQIISQDGTLYPTWARYKGCSYFCNQCANIKVKDVIPKVRNRILYRLNKMASHNLGSMAKVLIECPNSSFPKDIEKPKIELFAFRLAFGKPTLEQRNTAIFFGVEKELQKQNLCLHTVRSLIIDHLDPTDGSITITCPKLPADTDARIGVRRNPKNPNKKQKIFGYNAVFSTSIELHLGIELPVAINNIAGNAKEADLLPQNTDQIYKHHRCKMEIILADSKYDVNKNYQYCRSKGSIPIIDYNSRNENLNKNALLERGYDQNGWPFAPCGLLCRPNGFDKKRFRLSFCCFRQCLKLNYQALQQLKQKYNISSCPYINSSTGLVKHSYIKDNPRLLIEIPRGSNQFLLLKKLRSSSERTNSSAKADLSILYKPRVMNRERANILAQISAIVILLKRAFSFIARVTASFQKSYSFYSIVLFFSLISIQPSLIILFSQRRE